MTDKKPTRPVRPDTHDGRVHVNNDRNLPPITSTLPMPKVKPPKKD